MHTALPRSRLAAIVATVVGAACLAAAVPAHAQWKWRDKSGVVQYSDLPPPPGIADRDILQRPGGGRLAMRPAPEASSASAPAPTASGVDADLEAKRRKLDEDAAAKSAAAKQAEQARIAALRRDNCSQATAQLRGLDAGVRISRINDKGEREYLDDTARAAETQRMQAAVASNCN